jgi:phytoene dehydrogenase-like protein
MTGQWVFPGGGVPMCMAQGKNLIKMIVKQEKKACKGSQLKNEDLIK